MLLLLTFPNTVHSCKCRHKLIVVMFLIIIYNKTSLKPSSCKTANL